jgi:tetratricopeptide (TPR) repeat protein
MEEVDRVVVGAIYAAEQEGASTAEAAGESGGDRGGGRAPGEKKKPRKGEWFKQVVSGLIAIVTIMGALVAWRAAVANSDSGNNDSSGLLALQNVEETKAVADIQANGDEVAYVNYLRNRVISTEMLNDKAAASVPPDMQDYVARQITETIDLGNTSKFFFFPSNYLDQNDNYDRQRQVNEAYAQAQESEDLNFQQHFDTSDALSDKSMFLFAMLIVLAVALWLFAVSEVISNAVKYAIAAGGVLLMLLGGLGAYFADAGQAPLDNVAAIVWPATWLISILFVAAVPAMWVLPRLLSRQPRSAAQPPAGTPLYAPGPWPPAGSGQPAPPPQYPQPGYGPPPPGYGPPPNYGSPPPPGYGPPPPPAYVPPPPASPNAQPPAGSWTAPNSGPQPSSGAKAVQAKKIEGKEEEEEEEPFNRIVTVMIATVTLIAAIVAYLQADASNQADNANRNAQQYATQSLGKQTYGASELTYQDQAIVQAWKQLQVLSSSADAHNDPAAAKRYRDAADRIKGLSGIFDPKYFDPNTQGLPNDTAFAADLYTTQATGLAQRSVVQRDLHDEWNGRQSAYIANLSLLAVALALFGLALATSGFVRYTLAGAGVIIVGAAVVLALATFIRPVASTSDQAIDAYAKGFGLEQGGNFDEAVKAYSDALALQPGYADALYERGNVYFDQATDAYSSGFYQEEAGKTADAQTSYQLSTSKLEDAAKDFEAARAAGRDDTSVDWNLGWTYYLLGKFDDAVQMDRQALDKDPSTVPVRLNLGLALIAQGKDSEAEVDYNTAITRTSDQINSARDKGQTVSSDFWYYLDAGAEDLYNLLLRSARINFAFTQAPPRDKLANPDAAKQEAFNVMTKLRNKTTAFEYLAKNGQMPPESQVSASIDPPTFGAIEEGQPNEVQGLTFPDTTRSVNMYYTYKGIQKGQTVTFKIYRDYNHIPEYDYTISTWQTGESGDRQFNVTDPSEALSEYYDLTPGLWTVEIYVDYQLQQIGNFYIEDATETQQAQSQSTSTPPAAPPAPTPTP